MNTTTDQSWEKFLNPESFKQHLMAGGIYLAAYEMFKKSLIDKPREMYTHGFRDGAWIIGPEYKDEVLSLDPKHIFRASALWWQREGVFTEADVELANRIRSHRDEIAHDIPKFLGTAEANIDLDLLSSIYELLARIDQWWIREVEMPTDPDFDDKILTEEELSGVASGTMLFLSLMIPVAHGDDSRLRETYELWKKKGSLTRRWRQLR